MKKSHSVMAILTGLVALATAVQFTASFASGTPLTPPLTGTIVPTFNGLNIAAEDGTTLNISEDKAELSATKAGVSFPVVINDNLALAGGGGISAIGTGNNVRFFDLNSTGINIDAQIPIINNATLPDGLTGKPVMIADSEGLSVGPNAATPKLNINGQTGYISAPGGGPVTVANSSGFSVANDSAVEVFRIWGNNGDLEQRSGYAVGIYDDQGLEVGDLNKNIRFKVDGTSGAITNPYPPASTNPGGEPLYLNDDINVTGAISNNTAGKPVTISDAQGLVVKNPAWNLSSTFDLQGKLVNTNGALYNNMVAVDDPEGFGVFSGLGSAPQFHVAQNGDISHPGLACGDPPICSGYSPQPLKFTDDEGVYFANSAGTVGMKYTSGLLDFLSNPTIFLEGNSGAWGYKINVNDYGSGNVPLRFIERNNSVDTERMRIAQGGNVGIGTLSPTAMLSISSTGSEIGGSAKSSTLLTNAGALGGTAGNYLDLASIGFTSGNNVALGMRAMRMWNGADWTSTKIGLVMDVDNTRGAGASVWFRADGTVEIDHDLVVQSHLKAQEIGAYAPEPTSKTTVAIGLSASVTETCPGEIAVGCSYKTYKYGCVGMVCGSIIGVTDGSALQTTRYDINPGGGSCTVDFMNNSGEIRYAQVELECWDTNG